MWLKEIISELKITEFYGCLLNTLTKFSSIKKWLDFSLQESYGPKEKESLHQPPITLTCALKPPIVF